MNNKKVNMEEESGSTSDWMATYSDMMTLLLTFFVLLFAISNVDAQKFALLAAGLSKDGISADQFIEIMDEKVIDGTDMPDLNDPDYPGLTDDDPKPTPTPDPGEDGDGIGEELGSLHDLIANYIVENQLQESMQVLFQGDKLLLTLTNDIWFASGSADIPAVMKERAAELAILLRDTQNEATPFDIIAVGHTDNRPIGTSRYPSNWELSVDRAVKFLKILIEESALPANNFSARGCGEEMPIADNDTDEGRQLNRRVEVLITQPKQQSE